MDNILQERQEMVFQLMSLMGIDNTDIAYFLLKDVNWNLDTAVNSFLGEQNAPPPPPPPYIPQPQYEEFEQDFSDQPTLEKKKQGFNEMFPQLRLSQQTSDIRYQRLKKLSGKVDEKKLSQAITKLEQNKEFGERLRKGTKAIKNNKQFIMFLNKHFNTKIRFSFGSYTSNLALSFLRKRPLLVYVHKDIRMINGLLKALLQDPTITEFINKNFVVYGMFDSSDDYEIIAQDIPVTALPGVVCYYYDEKQNKKTLLGGHKLIQKDPLTIITFLEDIISKFKGKYTQTQLHQEHPMKKQSKKEEKKNQQSKNHSVIQQQDEIYRQMEQEFLMKRQVSRLNKQQISKKKQTIEKNKLRFQKQPHGGSIMNVIFRLPSGDILKRRFEKNQKIGILFTYVECFGSDKFENPYGEFDIIQTYPPLNLLDKRQQSIKEVFEDSEYENLIVRQK